ncbi:MAG: hypothetical protein QOG54_845 [Actinomycetota bacterium]|jgi:hypothetical protein|nr:hypothetical protein [Actinomycetota bacterium]
MTPIPTVVLTGTIGVGKTTLAESITELLNENGIRYAFIDLDGLGQVYPAPDPLDPHNMALQLRNLATIWPNYVSAGVERAVIAAALEAASQFAELQIAMPGAESTLIRVVAASDTVAARIKARDHGALLGDFLSRTNALARTISDAFPDEITVDNDNVTPTVAALTVLEKLDWRLDS